jgi:lipoprotein NlpD
VRLRPAASKRWVGVVTLLSGLLLSGCGGHIAPVSDYSINVPRNSSAKAKPGPDGYYRVKSGDTLYSIAWRYGKDYRGLARANKIDSNYRIYPGQRVRIAEAPPLSQVNSTPTPASRPEPNPAPRTPKAAPVSKTRTKVVPEPVGPVVWRWPAAGPVVQSFGAKGKESKGINIAGKRGEPVFSAAAGVVVYSGNALLGYGNLIIIKHNETFLSAYAHNNKLLVKEQDRVQAGQKIARIGNSGVTRIMLHFEIRKEGKPVDPIRYLPSR